jgi:hypothetical protein
MSCDGPGFMVAGDERQFAAQNYHVTDGGRNVSTSVSAGDLRCLPCGLRHSYRESIAGGSPVVVVLCDQSFPPILPSNNGNCTVVIRIEDGLLFEMEKVFFGCFCRILGLQRLSGNGECRHGWFSLTPRPTGT